MTKEQEKVLAKAICFPHTTGKQKDGDFKHHGYFTQEEGKGSLVKSTIAAGNGIYYDRNKLDDDFIELVKAHNFKRLARKRVTKTVLGIRALTNTANSAAYKWTEEQATIILKTLAQELGILENRLMNVKESKENKGYQFDF